MPQEEENQYDDDSEWLERVAGWLMMSRVLDDEWGSWGWVELMHDEKRSGALDDEWWVECIHDEEWSGRWWWWVELMHDERECMHDEWGTWRYQSIYQKPHPPPWMLSLYKKRQSAKYRTSTVAMKSCSNEYLNLPLLSPAVWEVSSTSTSTVCQSSIRIITIDSEEMHARSHYLYDICFKYAGLIQLICLR